MCLTAINRLTPLFKILKETILVYKQQKNHTGVMLSGRRCHLGRFLLCFRHSWKQSFSCQNCRIRSSSVGKLMDSGTASTILITSHHNTHKHKHIKLHLKLAYLHRNTSNTKWASVSSYQLREHKTTTNSIHSSQNPSYDFRRIIK